MSKKCLKMNVYFFKITIDMAIFRGVQISFDPSITRLSVIPLVKIKKLRLYVECFRTFYD